MSQRSFTFGGLSITVPESWENISSLNDDESPFTFADPRDGVGSLQLSPAIYKGGVLPNPSVSDLQLLVEEFAVKRELGDSFAAVSFSNGIVGYGASFHSLGDFIRVWYLSDGKSIVLATYICEWGSELRELTQVEDAVRGIDFTKQLSQS